MDGEIGCEVQIKPQALMYVVIAISWDSPRHIVQSAGTLLCWKKSGQNLHPIYAKLAAKATIEKYVGRKQKRKNPLLGQAEFLSRVCQDLFLFCFVFVFLCFFVFVFVFVFFDIEVSNYAKISQILGKKSPDLEENQKIKMKKYKI